MARKRRRYDDKFRANAVIMLQAAGYPDKKGSLQRVANHLSVPSSTLHGWVNGNSNPPPSDVQIEKKEDVIAAIQNELARLFPELDKARQDATYRELMVAMGIMVDKWLLLAGEPTERKEITGSIDYSSRTDDELRQDIANLTTEGTGKQGTG